eukprot:m.117268 g.117268  ORF g.117268 m.117268 type:complete len:58 (-) comp15420_c0_seq5:1263-1436(-)
MDLSETLMTTYYEHNDMTAIQLGVCVCVSNDYTPEHHPKIQCTWQSMHQPYQRIGQH